MRLSFDTIDEVKDFVKQLKGGRRTKGDTDGDDDTGTTAGGQVGGTAPAPLAPPPVNGGLSATNFVPGTAPGGAFTPSVNTPPNTMQAIVGRIVAQVDKLVAGQVPGQPAQPQEAVLQWLRTQIAPHDATANGATMDQVKQVYLNKLPEAALNEMARLIGA